jgi:hypothetical protein
VGGQLRRQAELRRSRLPAGEAVVAKEVLDVSLDYFSQMAALWVFIAYLVTGRHDKTAARAFGLAAVAVTAAVLALYAL